MLQGRKSGVLLHPTSLPSPFGVGDLGPGACWFADFLGATGQTLWQVLPLGHPGRHNSPYKCFSAFAGNPCLISPEKLLADGLLDGADLEHSHRFPARRVDYGSAVTYKSSLLRKCFNRFKERHLHGLPDVFRRFEERSYFWLEDYSLFMALREAQGNLPWTRWDQAVRWRRPEALAAWRVKLADEVLFHKFVQYEFSKQWAELKEYCNSRCIQVVGDMPIYVAHDSADVWAHPDLFQLDGRGNPAVVSGVPPDYFSATGQLWGNPVYRWDAVAGTGYRWWIERFGMNLALFDMVRLDHFRGFEAYWEVPGSESTAVDGRWVKGPGARLFEAVKKALGDLPLIAEDLGLITFEVDALREHLGLPGMKVLQMAFSSDPKAREYLPHNHVRNCVVYTATHDQNTTVGWFTVEPGTQTTQTPREVHQERRYALQYTGKDGAEINWDFIRLALGSVALVAIFPMQDILGLGAESRMNLPGTTEGNWEWRFNRDDVTPRVAHRLRELTAVYERAPVEPGR